MMGPMTVKQTADTLTVEREGRNGVQSTVYKLDGSESDVAMGQMTAKVSAKWDGAKIGDHPEDRSGRVHPDLVARRRRADDRSHGRPRPVDDEVTRRRPNRRFSVEAGSVPARRPGSSRFPAVFVRLPAICLRRLRTAALAAVGMVTIRAQQPRPLTAVPRPPSFRRQRSGRAAARAAAAPPSTRDRVAQVGAHFRQRAEDEESAPETRMRHRERLRCLDDLRRRGSGRDRGCGARLDTAARGRSPARWRGARRGARAGGRSMSPVTAALR